MSHNPDSPRRSVDSPDHEAFRAGLPFAVEPTNVEGIFSIPNPPDDFDPRTASRHHLLRNGILLRRPNAETESELLAQWNRFCDEHWAGRKHVNPRLETRVRERRTHRAGHLLEQAGLDQGLSWAGGFNQLPQGAGLWLALFGTWAVPTVSLPPGQAPHVPNVCPGQSGQPTQTYPAGPWLSATWLGLGGFEYATNNSFSVGSDLIQAGVAQNIDVDGNASYQAFYEWYVDNGAYSVGTMQLVSQTDFPVAAGDVISGSVVYIGSQIITGQMNGAQVTLFNRTKGTSFSHIIPAPGLANYLGVTCEWVMEATTPQGVPLLQDDSTFPAFTTIVFDCIGACPTDLSAVEQSLLYQELPGIVLNTDNSCLANGPVLTQTAVVANRPRSITINRAAS